MDAKKLVSAVLATILKVIVAIIVIFVVYTGASSCYDYGYRIFTEPAVAIGEGRDVTVTVTKEMSPLEIGKSFQEKGLVRDAKLFAVQYLFSEYRQDVQPGTFTLNTSMTSEEMMEVMATPAGEEETKDDN